MTMAIEACQRGIDAGQTPFGACVVRQGRAVACEHNRVWEQTDITAHAEVVAIRRACQVLGTVDLSQCVIYSTTEPCPMCFSAIHWARIGRIVFGTSIADAQAFGFHELEISNQQMKRLGQSPVRVKRGCLRPRCLQLFEHWQQRDDARSY